MSEFAVIHRTSAGARLASRSQPGWDFDVLLSRLANDILGLASREPALRRRAAFALFHRSGQLQAAELSYDQKMNVVLRESWRALSPPHDAVIQGLLDAMVADTTDLLAVSIIGQAIATAGEDGLTELLPLLSHDTFWIRAYAAAGIGSLDNGARWAVPSLCRALSRSGLDWSGYIIIRALGSIGGPTALDALEQLATEHRAASLPDPRLLQAIEEALASARSQE